MLPNVLLISFLALISVVVLVLPFFFLVQQQTAAIVQRWGRFHHIAQSGLRIKIPIMDTIIGRVSLRVLQLDANIKTKTKDNVFVNMTVSVQYRILPSKVYEAFYLLDRPESQITAYIFDVVRAQVPVLLLDELFERKDDIALAVKNELDGIMDDFGYNIIKALVTDIDPDDKVEEAMNEINAAQRLRVAAEEKGEAERILKVKAAEAEAQSKALQGKGIADQRREIINGLKDSVDEFQKGIPGASAQDVMNLILITQYFDTLKEIGSSGKSNAILLPHSPGALTDIAAQIQQAMLVAGEVKHVMRE
jgi:regulator of protease activity HflC (stomatin/prohibitin superfamily)